MVMDKSQITAMATIGYVGKIKIGLFPLVGRAAQHSAPYVKALYENKSASIVIDTGEIEFIKGFKIRELKEVFAWIEIHKEELLLAWNQIKSGSRKKPKSIQSKLTPPGLISIQPQKELVLRCQFDNGEILDVDFKNFDLPGILGSLKDQIFFEAVMLVDGIPTWGNEIDLDPDNLYAEGVQVKVAASC